MTHDEAVQIGYAVLRTYDKATAHDVSVVKNVVAALDGVGLLARPGELDAARATIAAQATELAALHAEIRRLRGGWTSPPVTTSGYDLNTAPGPTSAEDAAFTELVQLGQEIERSGEA